MSVRYDQHFMNDENVLNTIVDSSSINSDECIFEIGPGTGSLTRKILERRPRKVIAVEKDNSLNIDIDNKDLELVHGDGVDEMSLHHFDKLVANIPYSITEPLYTKILDMELKFVVLLHGIDFYKNLVERDTKWRYFVNAFYDVEKIMLVDGNLFAPKAKVKSVVVKLTLKKDPSDPDLFFQMLWKKRKRNVKNAIKYSFIDVYGLSKKDISDVIIQNIHFDKKLENLSNEEFSEVVDVIRSL